MLDKLETLGIKTNNDYSFLMNNRRIIFLTLGGSHAYGTNNEDSDLDIRGIQLNTKREILMLKDIGQAIDEQTDTVIYTTNKIVDLMANCNPNVIEMLGSLDRNCLFCTNLFNIWFRDNTELFLSKLAFYSFGGYAKQQLNRLMNKLGRHEVNVETENIIRSIKSTCRHIKDRYNIDIDSDIIISGETGKYKIVLENLDKENMGSCLNEIASIFRDYAKLGKRNKNAIEHNKLNKHCMQLIRLYLMAIDILSKGEIVTYRSNDIDLLMSIRNNENNQWIVDNTITDKTVKLIEELENKMTQAYNNSKLPIRPDEKKIEDLKMEICEYCIENNIKEEDDMSNQSKLNGADDLKKFADKWLKDNSCDNMSMKDAAEALLKEAKEKRNKR